MKYVDFAIEINPRPDGGFKTEIVTSPYGLRAGEGSLEAYAAEEVEALLTSLQTQIVDIQRHGPSASRSKALEQAQQRLGRQLHDDLFADDLGQVFGESLARMNGDRGTGLRVRLVWNPNLEEMNPVGALPWELSYRQRTREHLGRRRKTPFTRYLVVDRPTGSFEVEDQLRILVVASHPKNRPPLDSAPEIRRMREVLGKNPRIELHEGPPTIEALRDRMLDDGPFHVLHFIGHGHFDSGTGEGSLSFLDDEGDALPVAGDMVGEALGTFDELRLVVLSTCHGASLPRYRGQDPFTNIAPALLMAGVPAVIAMQFPISDAAATLFSRRFYQRLAANDPVDAAIAEARLALAQDRRVEAEWASPVLFTRFEDGRILRVPRGSVGGVRSDGGSSTTRELLTLGIRSFHKGYGEGMEERTDTMIALEKHFEKNRPIRDPALWNSAVFPELRDFLAPHVTHRGPIHLEIAAHASIAFSAGYCLEAKSGLDIRILQRRQGAAETWWPQDQMPPEGLLWQPFEDIQGVEDADDVAVAVSVTWPVLDDVVTYVRESKLPIGRILHASVPETGHAALPNGAYALRLAQQLARQVRRRSVRERRGVLHVFTSAPNVFVFFLGQLARGFGRVKLYEHPFGSGEVGVYHPSIELPPAGAAK